MNATQLKINSSKQNNTYSVILISFYSIAANLLFWLRLFLNSTATTNQEFLKFKLDICCPCFRDSDYFLLLLNLPKCFPAIPISVCSKVQSINILSDQQPKTQRYLIFYHGRLRKTVNILIFADKYGKKFFIKIDQLLNSWSNHFSTTVVCL